MPSSKKRKFKHFIFDVDGVFTNGQFLYSADGKFAKVFGPHDNDGIKMIRDHIAIEAITADKRGWKITKKRIYGDMKIKLTLVSEEDRLQYFKENFDPKECIYMADGIHDLPVFKIVGYSIAPNTAFPTVRSAADFITNLDAGNGAVAEACLHVKKKFLS